MGNTGVEADRDVLCQNVNLNGPEETTEAVREIGYHYEIVNKEW